MSKRDWSKNKPVWIMQRYMVSMATRQALMLNRKHAPLQLQAGLRSTRACGTFFRGLLPLIR